MKCDFWFSLYIALILVKVIQGLEIRAQIGLITVADFADMLLGVSEVDGLVVPS